MTLGIAQSARFTCECCGQEYELEKDDIQYKINRRSSGEGIHYTADIEELCFECGADIQIQFHAWEHPKGTIGKSKENSFGVEKLVACYTESVNQLFRSIQTSPLAKKKASD
ncbi:hypothetical protein L3Q72_20310 [Vibrio sp. JC009]|uniref:hypothetical protein n=1 Tax=Vibrio sp. JC009 TaxID=2912314 RepID=UPI0023AEF01F|nr:hypothetical protein [Vibrio sp. JC009]WED23582.1 hypothetical protein L3Q72_20310 [Vibrio sp. JC009]